MSSSKACDAINATTSAGSSLPERPSESNTGNRSDTHTKHTTGGDRESSDSTTANVSVVRDVFVLLNGEL